MHGIGHTSDTKRLAIQALAKQALPQRASLRPALPQYDQPRARSNGFARLPQLLLILLLSAAALLWYVAADPHASATPVAAHSRADTAGVLADVSAALSANANSNANAHQNGTASAHHTPATSADNLSEQTPPQEYAKDAQRRAQQQMEDDIAAFRAARAEPIGNLQQWLHDLWLRCQQEFAGQCQALLAHYHAQLSAEELQWLQQMLVRYQQYQAELGQVQLSTTLSPRDRFDVIDKMRNRLFADQTNVLFGQEQRLAQYQFGLDHLVQQQAPLLTPVQRLDALMSLQQQLTTQLPSELRHEITGAEATFQQALLLLQDVPATERQPLLQQLAEQLFADKAPSVLAYQQQIEQQRAQQQAYVQALQQLEQSFAQKRSQMTEAQWQAAYADALMQLRRQFFG